MKIKFSSCENECKIGYDFYIDLDNELLTIDLTSLPPLPSQTIPKTIKNKDIRRDRRSRNSLNHMNSQSTVNESEVWPPISKDNWIKVMVVADGPMLKYHGKKLERYILTLMQTVN